MPDSITIKDTTYPVTRWLKNGRPCGCSSELPASWRCNLSWLRCPTANAATLAGRLNAAREEDRHG